MEIAEALVATQESSAVDFKERFDPTAAADWCELVKDIVAMANSGGGFILIGVTDDGALFEGDPLGGRELDPATISDKLFRYTGEHVNAVSLRSGLRGDTQIPVVAIDPARVPIVFTSPGTYAIEGNRQRTAFGQGTVYFRHGAKSETGTTQDVRLQIEIEVARQREEWLGNVRKVIEAPTGSQLTITAPGAAAPVGRAVPVRLVNDADAQEVPHWDPDKTHPHRQKEVVTETNRRLAGRYQVTSHNVQCIRKVHGVDDNPHFSHKTRFSSRQYSDAFVDWIVAEFDGNPNFFADTRGKAKGG